MNTKKKVLFFISGPVPSAEQMSQADKLTNLRQNVMFRNGLQVSDDDSLEKCDYVAGDVPKRYAEKFERIGDLQLPGLEAAPETPAAPAPVAAPSPEPVVGEVAPSVPPLADNATNADIKAALVERGIEFPKNANKAALIALYNQ